jgi:hypothetical protein
MLKVAVNGCFSLSVVATFVRSGYPEAQEVKIDLLFFLELLKTSLILRISCTGSVKKGVATFF